MPGSHKFTALCPNRHELTLWTARAGRCDGCHGFVADGDQVMDCRACNWYLCSDCRPNSSEQVENIWGAVSNLFFGDVCRAQLPPHGLQGAEIVVDPLVGSARTDSDEEEPMARSAPPPLAPQQQEQQQHEQRQAASAADAMGETSSRSAASVSTGPPPPPPPQPPLVALEEAPAEKKVEQELVAAMPPPPPLAREMTDLIDLSVEPTAADPFDLSTVDFTATEAPKKAPLDGGALHGVAAALAGGA